MHSDLLEDQAEARLIQLRQQRLRKPSKAEKRGSQNTSSSATEYVTDAIKAPVVPMPGTSFMNSQSGGTVYAPKQLSMGPARDQSVIVSDALPALAPQFHWDPSQANAPAGVAPVLAVESRGRAERRQFSPVSLRLPPALENLTPAAWGMNIASWAVLNRPTLHLRAETLPARRSSLGELISLVGYMVGAAAIFGLYLIIPLMILLSAILPATWNKLIVALPVLMLGELTILLILVKTTPRRKARKRNMLVQP